MAYCFNMSISKSKKLLRYLIVFAICCFITIWVRYGDSISLNVYKNKVKRYIDQQEYSERTKEILFVAVDHIKNPQNISDYKKIDIWHNEGLIGSFPLVIDDGSIQDVIIDANDWYVLIGDSGMHRYYNAVIDDVTLEYLGSVPIA